MEGGVVFSHGGEPKPGGAERCDQVSEGTASFLLRGAAQRILFPACRRCAAISSEGLAWKERVVGQGEGSLAWPDPPGEGGQQW